MTFDGRNLLALTDAERDRRNIIGKDMCDDLPGADDLAQSGLHLRRPDRCSRS